MRRSAAWLALAALLSLLAGACGTSPYPVDVFPEMHYQPSQRRLEPDRLSAPPGAVPVTGGAPRLTFEQAGTLPNPVPASPETLDRARQVYGIDCAACHGSDARGSGPLAAYYARNPAATLPPTDLSSQRVQARGDGQLYWIVRNGLGGMPPFGDLRSEEDVWALVRLIRLVQQQ